MKICVLAVLAYRNSFILFKLLKLNDNCLRLFLACGRTEMKKKKPIKSKRKTYDLSHQKIVFQNECHAKELHILTTLSSRCLRFFLFWTFSAGVFVWDFSFNHEQHCNETALVPLRRVKYYTHVKSDLCYNITWRNRPTELAGEHNLIRWMF